MEETPNQEVEEVLTNPEPEVEEQQTTDAPTEDVQEEPVEEPAQEQETPEAEAEEEKPPSRREQLRIQQLLTKLKDKDTKSEVPGGVEALDYATALNADPEVVEQLQADRKRYGEELYQRGLQQANSMQFHTRLEIDAPKVEAKYAQLNKESDQFDPAIADALNSAYLQLVGYDERTDTVQNPNIRYADYIEAQFELANALASEKTARTTKNIAKQAAATGLRPDGSTAKRLNLDKAPEDMTVEELQAKIAQSLPK